MRTRSRRFEPWSATIAVVFPTGGETPPSTGARPRNWRQSLRLRLRLEAGGIDALGRESSFNPDVGANWASGEPIRGYYIDFTVKAEEPRWPTYWLAPREKQEHVSIAQWGLGCYERYLNGDGEAWLEAAQGAGRHLLDNQHHGGTHDGGWQHLFSVPHTYRIDPPWLSAMAQGEGASLLVRLYRETGEERYAEAAQLALKPMGVPVAEGGTLAELDGAPFVEEYPTQTPSYVLNGAIFALWGYYDVGHALGDSAALDTFEQQVTTLASSLWRYDTGYWSRYDLYPHALPNIASPAYHLLHIRQLRALARMASRPEFEPMIERFEKYRASRIDRSRAMAQKIAFRIAVPRNSKFAHRLPWHGEKSTPKRSKETTKSSALVLCYHAVSPTWPAALSVTPEQFSAQLRHLVARGYKGTTFGEIARGEAPSKAVAITFDDGYQSVYRFARPILDAFDVPATVFVPTDFIGSEKPMTWPGIDQWLDGEHEHELTPMSWDEIKELRDAGWEIGSHTKSHPKLTQLNDVELKEQLAGSRRECEHQLGVCDSIAFPYGDHDDRVVEATAAAGYSVAATLPAGYPRPTPLRWPRVGVYHADSGRSFRLKTSPAVLRLRRSRAWPTLVRVAGRGGFTPAS